MKHINVIASIILAAAVLLAAYAIGRLIRQSRMDKPAPETVPVASPNDVRELEAVRPGPPVSPADEQTKQEERAQLKEQRAAKLAEMEKLTDEEKKQKRDQWREQLRSKRGGPTHVPHLSPEEMEQIKNQLAGMSEEERQKLLDSLRDGAKRRPRVTVKESTDPNKTD